MTRPTRYDELKARLEAGETLTGEDSDDFRAMHGAVVEAFRTKTLAESREAGDWELYLFAYGGGHERLEGLVEIAEEIQSAETFWRCVADVWMHDDAPGLNENDWRYVLTEVRGAPGREAMMTEAEREALAALPDPLTVFRGFVREGGERGFAWTLDYEKAEWFALGFHDSPRMDYLYGAKVSKGPPRLATGVVAKRDVFAYLTERNESEVLVLPETVTVNSIETVDVDDLEES